MKKGIEKHKEFLIGILIGIIPMIIKIAGWTAILIVLLLVITFSIYIFYIQTETGMKEEEEFQKLFKKIDEELKNVVPEAYTKVELRTIKEDDTFGKALNALIYYGTINFYARVNYGTQRVRIIVIQNKKERVFEDEITCELFEKLFEIWHIILFEEG